MARTHTMTPARKAALKKAQMASARKRRGKGKGKLAAANRRYDASQSRKSKIMRYAVVGAGGALAAAAAYKLGKKSNRNFVKKRTSGSNEKIYFDKSLGAYYTKKPKARGSQKPVIKKVNYGTSDRRRLNNGQAVNAANFYILKQWMNNATKEKGQQNRRNILKNAQLASAKKRSLNKKKLY